MKKITLFLKILFISPFAFSQLNDKQISDSIEIYFDSSRNEWTAVSQYVLLSTDTSGIQRIQIQAMIVHQGNQFVYKGFVVVYKDDTGPCIDSARVKINFTDGSTYIKDVWNKKNCDAMCFFDLYGDDSYVLKKKIKSIYFKSKKNESFFYHKLIDDETSNYFIRIGNALNKKEFIVRNYE